MSTPLVSVLVTVYNREKYLDDCIGSILKSSFQDFEIIVVDDCSQDRSWEKINALAATDERIRPFLNAKNLGDYANRNEAASQARGRFLKYVDADDMVYPHALQVMVDAMHQFPDAALGLSLSQIDPLTPYPFCGAPAETMQAHFLGKSRFGVGPTAAIIRTDAFRELGGFSGRQFVGDTELWYQLGERWPLVNFAPALVWWRQHEGQQMTLEKKTTSILNVRYQLELETLRKTQHLNAGQKARAAQRIKQRHARRILSMALKEKSPGLAKGLFRSSGLSVGELLAGFKGY